MRCMANQACLRSWSYQTPPGPGEVVVRVLATSLNRIDAIVRRGYPGIPVKLPHVPGADIVGYIESARPGTDLGGEFRVGDLVLVSNVWGAVGPAGFVGLVWRITVPRGPCPAFTFGGVGMASWLGFPLGPCQGT